MDNDFYIENALNELSKADSGVDFADVEFSDIILFDDVSKIDVGFDEDLDGAYPETRQDQSVLSKFTLSREEVAVILEKLKKCYRINQNDYYKTLKFLKEFKLSLGDCLDIIHGLKVDDYYANTKSRNPDHIGNNLMIFEPSNVKLSGGRIINNVVIYIKIDVDDTTNEAIALVSIHKGSQDKLPYKNDDK